ncbi:MAG TPA: multicopper oxidase domain-containing protein [Xanthobacteraceae bacterium]|jgi:FtsP/CotA-like multicopper oxidase with cupredoxin domain
MSIKTSLTRRQVLLLSGAAAAGLTFGSLPQWARSAPTNAPSLPIPALIEARNGEPVTLSLQKSVHRFGHGAAVPSTGISSSYLGPVVRVRSGDTIPFRVENHLNEDTTLHWHGLLVPSYLDGGPHNMIRPGGVWTPEINIKQPPATTWFHSHPHGSTARQVYLGLAGMMIVSDGGDRDRGLPATYGVDDIPLVLQDKRFGRNGELVYSPTMMDIMHGFQGDTLLVNGAIGPVATVPAGFVRLRLLNAANARNFDLRFSDRRPFFVIAGDAGLLPEPVELRNLVIAPAERYEILVNFSDGRPADLLTAPDTHHDSGSAMMMPIGRRIGGSAETEVFMQFRPDAALKVSVTQLPRELSRLAPPDIASAVAWRTFVLNPMMGMMQMMGMSGSPQMMGINGRSFSMGRVDVTTKLGTSEIWDIQSTAMAHPFHIHGVSFRILSNGGRRPRPEQSGWKDVVLVAEQAEILVRFGHPAAPKMPFMYHCHILEHEDHGMMGQFAVV